MLHVIGRCVHGDLLFPDDDNAQLFWSELGYRSLEFGVQILAVCLLGNHYHLLVRGEAEPLAETMHRALSKLANVRNRRAERRGALVGRRYNVVEIDDEWHERRVIRYVPMNPVLHQLARDPAAWTWSTHPILIGQRAAPVWFDRTAVLKAFGFLDAKAYERFVLEASPLELPPMSQAEAKRHRVLVLARTGLSAERIAELTGFSQRHVHRLIAVSAVELRTV